MLSRACCLALASRTALYMVLPMWNQFLSGVGGLKRHVLGTGAISYCKKTCQDWYNDQWLAHSPRFVSCLCSQELPVNHKTITYFSYYLVNFSVTFLKESLCFFIGQYECTLFIGFGEYKNRLKFSWENAEIVVQPCVVIFIIIMVWSFWRIDLLN